MCQEINWDALDKLEYDPHAEGTDTSLSLIVDLDFDSASAGLAYHLRGKVMGWCDFETSLPRPGEMHFSLWQSGLGSFAELVLRRVDVHRSAIDYWPIFVPTFATPPFSDIERVAREERNYTAKEHLKTVLSYALEQMCAETSAESNFGAYRQAPSSPVITRQIKMLATGVHYQSHKVVNAITDYARYEVQLPVQMQHCGRFGEHVWDVYISSEAIGHIRFVETGDDLWAIDQVYVSNHEPARELLDMVGDALIVRLQQQGLLTAKGQMVNSEREKESLQRQIADARENLRVIEERKAKYVQEIDVPLQYDKDELRLTKLIAELEEKLSSQSK